MGLVNNNGKVFLGVTDGKITQLAKEDTPGAKKSEKNGKVTYKVYHDAIEGIITDIRIRENEFNGEVIKSWALTIQDGGDVYQLEVGIKGGYGNGLIKSLANPEIDFSKPLKLTPWMKVVNDKKKTAMYVSQGEKQIDWYFTKENPNGLPDAVQTRFNGKDVWDFFDQMQFMEKYVEEKIKPKLKAVNITPPTYTPPTTDPNVEQLPDDDDLNDLPF